MQENNALNDEDRDMESALKALLPAPNPIDPIAAAFAAGQNSARRATRAWQGAFAVAAMLGLAVFLRPVNVPPAPNIATDEPKTVSPDLTAMRIEMDMIDRGWNAIPPVRGDSAKPIRPSDSF